MSFFSLLTDPLAFGFMQKALWIAALVGTVCAVLSCYLVLKGWALMGDAVSHAVLPGVVIAYIVGLPVVAGAFAAGLFSAVATGFLKENSRIKEDTVMGIVFSGMFGLGIVLFTQFQPEQHLDHILFGNLLGIARHDLIETSVIAIATLFVVIAKRRDLLLYCFDPQHAQAIGLPVSQLYYGLLIVLALTIVASLKAVGIILVVAMLIGPGATAFLLTSRFDWMVSVAVGSAVLASVVGVLVSFHIDGATGPCIVLVQTALFLLALGYSLLHRRHVTVG